MKYVQSKYKECPKCRHKNVSYTQVCDNCNADISSVVIKEANTYVQTGSESFSFSAFLNLLSLFFLLAGIIGCAVIAYKFAWINVSAYTYSEEMIFNPIGFGVAVGTLFSGLFCFATLGGIKRLLDKD